MIENLPTLTGNTEVANADLFKMAEPVALDDLAEMVYLEGLLRSYIKEYKEKLEDVQAKLQAATGGAAAATLKGKTVFTYDYINKLRETDLKKEEPGIHSAFSRPVEDEKLDITTLRLGRPEIYRKHQVRVWKKVS
jgi:ABC-type Fe3+ transport system substrate-binding protein